MASSQPSAPLTRKILASVLRTDSEFDAFCLDYFPDVHRRFSSGMDRLQKATTLLDVEYEHLDAILDSLLQFKPESEITIASLIGADNTIVSREIADEAISAVSEKDESLLIDNWLLQDAGAFLNGSLSSKSVADIEINNDPSKHMWQVLPKAVVQVESVLALLSEIVLRERLLVDSGWVHAWEGKTAIEALVDSKVLLPTDFTDSAAVLPSIRSSMVNEICITDSMRAIQQKNEQAWVRSQKVVDGFSSQMFWGTAGYLARADILQIPYSGHPLRRNLLLRTALAQKATNAGYSLHKWIDSSRIKLSQQSLPSDMHNVVLFLLPPVAVEIIESCDSIDKLILTALQFREEFQPLRRWISLYQMAISERDPQILIKHQRDLQAVATEIETKYKLSRHGDTFFRLSARFVNSANPAVQRKLGVRALISKLAQTKLGDQSFRILLKMVGEEKSLLGKHTLQHLQKRSMMPLPSN